MLFSGTQKIITDPYNSKYCHFRNYWKADDEYLRGNHITLVLHSTIQYIPYLEEHLETWGGGISVALFIPAPVWNETEEIAHFSKTQLYYKAVFSALQSPLGEMIKNSNKVSLHIYFEKKSKICPVLDVPEGVYGDLGINFKDTFDFEDIVMVYPINVGRNIARQAVETELFISGDIEQFFVPLFEERMKVLGRNILIENKKKTVLVHRRFEIEDGVDLPKNKQQLAVLLANKTAYPFHLFHYYIGHEIPHLEKWLETPENFDFPSISEVIQYQNREWEPQFVGDWRVPLHDERFPYRYRNNVVVSYQLCFQDFTFSVVNDLFSVHRGVKRGDSLKIKRIKELVKIPKNFALRRKHWQELAQKYPETNGTCPR